MMVFVVMGTTGEYSDGIEWPVLAFTDEEDAKRHVENASRRANEIQVTRRRHDLTEPVNEFDKEMKIFYTGTSYYYFQVEMRPPAGGVK